MCDECRYIAADHIMDYVNLGLHLEIAIRLERDAVVQHSLRDRVGQDAIDVALHLSDTVVEVGEELAAMLPEHWELALANRAIQYAMERSESGP